MKDWSQELEGVLREEIPLTQAMGLTVASASLDRVVLNAPLEPNHNHKRTAFGGSLYSLAVLAGWSLLWVRLKEAGLQGHVVIASSEVEYLKPVVEDFQASAEADGEALRKAVALYRRRGKARVQVTTVIGEAGSPALRCRGIYAFVQ